MITATHVYLCMGSIDAEYMRLDEFMRYVRFRKEAAGFDMTRPIEHHPRWGYTVFSQERIFDRKGQTQSIEA